jgi:hypothetical protein
VEDVGLRGFVGANCTENDTVGSITRATVLETRSVDSHGEVSLVQLQHSNNLLDTVHNEVSSKLLRFFLSLNKERGRVVLKVTSVRLDHDRYLAKLSSKFNWISAIDAVLKSS